MSIIDFIFPKRCINCKKVGEYICPDCFVFLSFDVKNTCLICGKPTINGLTHPGCVGKYSIDGSFSCLPYNKIVQRLIYNFKYKPYLSSLSETLTDLFFEGLIQKEEFQRELEKKDISWILVSIPLFKSKLRKRGYNQAEILAKGLSKRLNIKMFDILERVKDTKSQFDLNKIQRRKNVKGAFSLNSSFIIHNSSFKKTGVFLVDDIATTGATLMEAARILKRKGAKRIIGLTLARD